MFAEKNGMTIIETFIDDGVSAKDFNRPEWKRLESKLKSKSVQGVIVWKYDRLIRNVMEGLAFLDKAEKLYGVTIYSAMETFSINPFDPMFFKIRADILVNGEYERRIITDRTNFGIWSAKMQGKYVGQAPYGYLNARDDKNKPIIIVDETKRQIIEYIFNAFAIGQSPTRIQFVANEMGMNRHGHDTVRNIVTNPVYKGYILAPDYKGHGAKLVKGIHEGLIDIESWDKCQVNLKSDKPKSIISDDLPLRGFARCMGCGDVMTGGRTKGRSAFYHYYRCFNCKNVNLNTNEVEKKITSILNALSLPSDILDMAKDNLIQSLGGIEKQQARERIDIMTKIEQVKGKKESIEEKYIDGKVDHETYSKWVIKFNQEIKILNSDFEYITNKKGITQEVIDKNIKKLSKLGGIYQIASPIEKQELCRYIFSGHLYLSNRTYRTGSLSSLFDINALKINDLELMNIEDMKHIYSIVPESTPFGRMVEPDIVTLLNILHKITG
jgi:DNA invertase Pin-like site-specific DNA recombinase